MTISSLRRSNASAREPAASEKIRIGISWTAVSVAIDSGFGDSGVQYGPVAIGAGTGGDPGSFPALPLGAAVLAIILAVAGVFGIRRLRRLAPASN